MLVISYDRYILFTNLKNRYNMMSDSLQVRGTDVISTSTNKEKELQEPSERNIFVPAKRNIEFDTDVSVHIVGLVTFVGDSARGILFPVLWPLCQYLGGNNLQYGKNIHDCVALRTVK